MRFCTFLIRLLSHDDKRFQYLLYWVSLFYTYLCGIESLKLSIMAILKLYNDIQTENEKNLCKWWGETEGVCFKDIDEFVEQMDADDGSIELHIFCDGGSVMEGWAIYDKLRATGKDITAIVEGKAASMATVVLMAAPKERRKAYKSAQVCVHNPWVPGYSLGDQMTADDLQRAADDLKQQQDKILDLYVERCGCDREEMQALMDEDKYIGADEAKSLGIIGEIIAPASAKKGAMSNNKKMNKMAEVKDEKVEVKASIWKRIMAKLGIESVEDLEKDDVKGMDLSTADGGTLTVEREEGNPQVGDKASPDGEHEMPDGSTIVVKDGVISEIKPKDGEEKKDDDDEKDAKIQSLEDEVADLKGKLQKAEANAKTVDDLRILNAVKIAGGEKALAKLSSSYKPAGRKVEGHKASDAAEDAEVSPMRAEIEARRNGTFKKGDKKE